MTTPYDTYAPLLAKSILLGPCYVTAHDAVSDSALEAAARTLDCMLANRPDVSINLRAHGAVTAVFGKTESVYDLEYFASLPDKPPAEGGLGGTVAIPVTAVSERNLLKLPCDPYQRGSSPYGANVVVHELAHTIMNIGLEQTEIARIHFRWRDALKEGLWKNDWASTNYMEFFAELSQMYFNCACPSPTDIHLGINGPEELAQYDKISFALIHGIYRGASNLS